jgi:hypothetical protein
MRFVIRDPKKAKTGSALFQPEVTLLAVQLFSGLCPTEKQLTQFRNRRR